MLTYLYYFIISDGNDKYLKLLFCVEEKCKTDIEEAEKATKAVEKTKEWISQVCGEKMNKEAWNTFVDIHFIPVCMFNNQPLQYAYFPYYEKQLRFLPGTLEECECFFRTCNTAILERSRLIQEKIKKR